MKDGIWSKSFVNGVLPGTKNLIEGIEKEGKFRFQQDETLWYNYVL